MSCTRRPTVPTTIFGEYIGVKVPRAADAFVDTQKITRYLLSPSEPKSAVFVSVGYRVSEWQVLEQDLLRLIRQTEYTEVHTVEWGSRYVVDGVIVSPSGKVVALRTVWQIEQTGGSPRLITAYPR